MPDSNRSEVVSVNCEGFSTPPPPPPPPPFVYMILLKLAYSIGDQTVQIKLRRNVGHLVHGSQVNCLFQKM